MALTAGRGELVVEVRSRRPVGGSPRAALPGAGTGLIGLAERVEIAGGSFRHGPDAAGDFLLRAVLPLEGAARGRRDESPCGCCWSTTTRSSARGCG